MIGRAKVICNTTISSIYNTHVWRNGVGRGSGQENKRSRGWTRGKRGVEWGPSGRSWLDKVGWRFDGGQVESQTGPDGIKWGADGRSNGGRMEGPDGGSDEVVGKFSPIVTSIC